MRNIGSEKKTNTQCNVKTSMHRDFLHLYYKLRVVKFWPLFVFVN